MSTTITPKRISRPRFASASASSATASSASASTPSEPIQEDIKASDIPEPIAGVNGLYYTKVSLDGSAYLAELDALPWFPVTDTPDARRVQHYGYLYDYKRRTIGEKAPDLPRALYPLRDLLTATCRQLGILPPGFVFNQCIVNEYNPSQGIAAHKDAPVYGGVIGSFTFGSGASMVFRKGGEQVSLYVEPESLYIMAGEARTDWTHEMPARLSDIVDKKRVLRGRRVSVTFRNIPSAPDFPPLSSLPAPLPAPPPAPLPPSAPSAPLPASLPVSTPSAPLPAPSASIKPISVDPEDIKIPEDTKSSIPIVPVGARHLAMNDNFVFIDSLYRSRLTLLDILRERGYNVSKYEKFSPAEATAAASTLTGLSFLVSKTDDEKKQCHIRYENISQQKLKNGYFTQLVSDEDSENVEIVMMMSAHVTDTHHAIALKEYMRLKEEPNDKGVKERRKLRVSFFTIDMLVINPLRHVLVPKHEIIPEEDHKALMERIYVTSKSKFPEIKFHVDPIARCIGAVPGDIIKIIRPSASSGEAIIYRVCAP